MGPRALGAHGGWAEQVTIGSRSSGDQKLIIEEDSGACAPSVKPGQTFTLSAWYTSTAPTSLVVFYRKPEGGWVFWARSPQTDTSTEWKQFSWQTPPIPADATRLSFGLQLASVGTLTTDDYADGFGCRSIAGVLGQNTSPTCQECWSSSATNPGNHRHDPRHSGGCRGGMVIGAGQ